VETPTRHAAGDGATTLPLLGVCEGCGVFVGGRQVGVVEVADAAGFTVKVGLFGRRRVFVPHSDVERVDEKVQAVYLSRFAPHVD
jgi:hypothetical protein